MKQYRLKQWYPSLLKDVRVGDIITENGQHYKGVTYKCISYRVEIWQLHPDFWELIEEKEPLFVTDDGVEVFYRNTIVYNVRNNTLEKIKIHSIHLNEYDFGHKVFYHESNADEYVWKNKRVFSYEDMMKAKHSILITNEDIEKSAKERIEV